MKPRRSRWIRLRRRWSNRRTITATITVDGGNNVCGGRGVFFFDGAELPQPGRRCRRRSGARHPLSGTATLTTVVRYRRTPCAGRILGGTENRRAALYRCGRQQRYLPTLTVIGAQSTTVLSITPNPIPAGETVTLAATGQRPGGDVTTGLGRYLLRRTATSCGTVPVIGGPLTGTATLTTSFADDRPARTSSRAFNGTDSVGGQHQLRNRQCRRLPRQPWI